MFFKLPLAHQTQFDTLTYNQQQPPFDNNYYQTSLPAVPANDSISIAPSQEAVSQADIYHQQDQSYIATSNEIPEVDSYSNSHLPSQQTDIQSSDSQQPQPQQLLFNNQENFQADLSQTTFAGAYDYYNQNISSHQAYEVSF